MLSLESSSVWLRCSMRGSEVHFSFEPRRADSSAAARLHGNCLNWQIIDMTAVGDECALWMTFINKLLKGFDSVRTS